MTKRSAFGVCRCVGAISFGRIVCTPANSAGVMNVVPGSAGFSSMSTRRSASLAVISSQARISSGRTSSHRQSAGTAAVPGFTRITRSHSGFRFRAAISLENRARSALTTAAEHMRVLSIELELRLADELSPLRALGAQELGELLRGASDRGASEAQHALLHLGSLHGFGGFGV